MIEGNKKRLCAYPMLVVLFLTVSACVHAFGENWSDDALLHDGRVVNVHRKVAFHLSDSGVSLERWPDVYSFKAKHPDTGETIAWTGERHVHPILLDFVDRTPYLVIYGGRLHSNVKLYGCPDIPYVFLRYEKETSEWVPISPLFAPTVLRTPNLTPSYSEVQMHDGYYARQTKERIASVYARHALKGDIPRTYDEWNVPGKELISDNRYPNDCRPFPKERDSINPKLPSPPSLNVALELLGYKEFDPEWLIDTENRATSAWSKLASDPRHEACQALFRPADSRKPNGWQSFIKDTTGQKITANSSKRLCDDNFIWQIDYGAERRRAVIIKASHAGEVIYRISFERPVEIAGYMGHFMDSTIKAENGYLYFEWWHTAHNGAETHRHVKRILKLRFHEPEPSISRSGDVDRRIQ